MREGMKCPRGDTLHTHTTCIVRLTALSARQAERPVAVNPMGDVRLRASSDALGALSDLDR
jgi:hypothetical protein